MDTARSRNYCHVSLLFSYATLAYSNNVVCIALLLSVFLFSGTNTCTYYLVEGIAEFGFSLKYKAPGARLVQGQRAVEKE